MNIETELRQQLAGRLPALADMELERHGDRVYRLQKMHVERYANQGVVLLGDTAHVTHPAAGLGMNMALQDAETLAEELSRAFQGQSSLDDAYLNYERIRRQINQSVINRANFMAWQMWSPSIWGFLGRTCIFIMLQLLPFIRQKLARSLAWANAGIQSPTRAT
jgi:2-polyprenyl-6-methoxyphenol hydroxylase-like FAD-dependent oxidoreductase